MDSFGSLQLSWTVGYSGSQASYITEDVLCFTCGNNVKFMRNNKTVENIYQSTGNGIGVLSVHKTNSVFAYSESSIDPWIIVVSYPSMKTLSKFKGAAKLEILFLEFSASELLLTVSGIPDFQLIVWNYTDATKLCSHDLDHVVLNWISFNPGNWRQVAISTDKYLSLWTIEPSNKKVLITEKKIKLFVKDHHEEKGEAVEVAKAKVAAKAALDLPLSAITGLSAEKAAIFEDYIDKRERVRPLTHIWAPSGDLIVGCEGGMLKKIDIESFEVETILSPGALMNITVHFGRQRKESSSPDSGYMAKPDDTFHDGKTLHKATSAIDVKKSDSALKYEIEEKSASKVEDRSASKVEDRSIGKVEEKSGSKVEEKNADVRQKHHRKDPDITDELNAPDVPDREIESAEISDGSFNRLLVHQSTIYAGGLDGILRQIELRSSSMLCIVQKVSINAPITSLAFNPTHSNIAIGSAEGTIHVAKSSNLNKLQRILSIYYTDFISICAMASESDYCVTLRESGHLQIWNTDNGSLLTTFSLNYRTTSMDVSPFAHVAAVGTEMGCVYMIDLSDLKHIRIVSMLNLHKGPVLCTKFGYDGNVFVTGSNDGRVFVVNGRASRQFQPIGYTTFSGIVDSASASKPTASRVTRFVLTAKDSMDSNSRVTKLIAFNVPAVFSGVSTQMYSSLKCDFKDEVINKLEFSFPMPVFGVALTSSNKLYAISQLTRELLVHDLPEEMTKKENTKEAFLSIIESHPGHDVSGGKVYLSDHGGWLGSCGRDGDVIIRDTFNLDRTSRCTAHSYVIGGARDMLIMPDGQSILSIGFDRTLCCYKWLFSEEGKEISREIRNEANSHLSSIEHDRLKDEALLQKLETWESREASVEDELQENEDLERQIEEAILKNEIYVPKPPKPKPEATWSEMKENEAEVQEFMKNLPLQRELREELRSIRKTLLQLLQENETKPEIEKLARHEFDLDVEEQRRLQISCDTEVQRIREDQELENLSKMYLTECIKRECWDEMEVKGRGLLSFNTPLEVYNYPLRQRTPDQLQQLELIKSRRAVEIAESMARKKLTGKDSEANSTMPSAADEEITADPDQASRIKRGRMSLMGSLACEVGGESELIYSQFDLCSREQKIAQIILIQDVIQRIKVKFNEEFDEVFSKKEGEIRKIQERNVRIRKILDDTGLPDVVYEPEMTSIEKPELLFITTDAEVKVERYLTAEQKKKLDEDRAQEERRRMLEKADNWRERGLDYMMGGVLEIKKEDELKKDVPIPAFMQDKPQEEWTDEEKKFSLEYHKKVKELEEEREKFRKQLEAELHKLQQMVADGTKAFDEVLLKLFMKKIETELILAQEELKIVRLRESLLVEEELANRENELIHTFDITRKQSQAKILEVSTAKKELEEFRIQYDIMLAEDKVMEKSFKRDFSDVPSAIVEQLVKQYRRRPRGQKAKVTDLVIIGNPQELNAESRQALEAALLELNNISNKPEACDIHIWERLCKVRRDKMEHELKIKQTALVLADMQAFIQHRQDEDEALKNKLESLLDATNKLREAKHKFVTNLEIQLLLKQGQVEVDPGSFVPDYSNSLLIDQSVVEVLNKRIRTLGEAKIASMIDSKDFRKGILKLEWEHKKLSMEIADLKNRMTDITRMKVTREIQEYLRDSDYFAKKNQEVTIIEQTMATVKEVHERRMQEKKKRVEELKEATQDLRMRNGDLTEQLTKINVAVNRRKHVYKDGSKKLQESERKSKYKAILERHKIVDLAKAQAHEISVLPAEVERLRMRNFAALDVHH